MGATAVYTRITIAVFVCLLCCLEGEASSKKGDTHHHYHTTKDNEAEKQRWCSVNCMGDWEPWTQCSKRCAGGTRTRSRVRAHDEYCAELPCTLAKTQKEPCNEFCIDALPWQGQCQCPDSRAGECCENEILCPYPDVVAHGSISGSWPARVGAVASFDCDAGFNMEGDDTSVCSSTSGGTWTQSSPQCQRIECSAPEVNENVVLLNEQAGYAYSQQTFFKCEHGYELEGPNSRECVERDGTALWTGFPPLCTAIRCPELASPLNGVMDGDDFSFGNVVDFDCNENFRLVGSNSLTCGWTGNWVGTYPSCEELACDAPYKDQHGYVTIDRNAEGQFARFFCEDGYVLFDGDQTLKCVEQNGHVFWDGIQPRCTALDCGHPGEPENGYIVGGVFSFPGEVSFRCFHGYMLTGQPSVTCQIDARWSAVIPQCQACPMNTYDDGTGSCAPCPDNSHTQTDASTSPLHCMCDTGYIGENGGACSKVECITLEPPEYGEIILCNNTPGGQCEFFCDDGYIMSQGTSLRTCQSNGVWSGTHPFCSPCEIDTYKASSHSCMACPENSGTQGLSAQNYTGCVCKDGYLSQSGSTNGNPPCVDIDECVSPSGSSGPCEDECYNLDGDYICQCTVPGAIVSPDDRNACVLEESCHRWSTADAPANGAAVCHYFEEHNSASCAVRCNPGHEPVADPHGFTGYGESCGPHTGFNWTDSLPDCAESMFPRFTLYPDIFYLTSKCNDLTETEQQETTQAYVDVLNQNDVCAIGLSDGSSSTFCDIDDVTLVCGEETTGKRKKRGTDGAVLYFHTKIESKPMIQNYTECGVYICSFLGIRHADCTPDVCFPRYRAYIKAAMGYTSSRLNQWYNVNGGAGKRKKRQTSSLSLSFTVNGRDFAPHSATVADVETSCEDGMVIKGDNCLKCPEGTFHNRTSGTCYYCPAGFYQHQQGQVQCLECPPGTTSYGQKNTYCTLCSGGTWGLQCSESCTCVHGICNIVNGTCSCNSGYEGQNCDQDMDGCVLGGGCAAGVQCYDEPAPSSGFTCGPCPLGYSGDGYSCVPVDPECPYGLWGAACNETCDCGNGYCNDATGECTCVAGWRGLHCDQECAPGSWGQNCAGSCHCANGDCDPVTGACQCHSGWMGDRCQQVCPEGLWSAGCVERCECLHGSCNPVTGNCNCDPGYMGQNCDIGCDSAHWGPDCINTCLCANGECDVVTGACTCYPGWRGARCNRIVCGCLHGMCNGTTGECMCLPGWQGHKCEQDIPGCAGFPCYPGVTCEDVPAPGDGFVCGPCPPGLTGNGEECEPLPTRASTTTPRLTTTTPQRITTEQTVRTTPEMTTTSQRTTRILTAPTSTRSTQTSTTTRRTSTATIPLRTTSTTTRQFTTTQATRPTKLTTTPAKDITTGPKPIPGCVEDCTSVANGNYPSCDSCYGYTACSNGYTYKMACPGGLAWNPAGYCDWNSPLC